MDIKRWKDNSHWPNIKNVTVSPIKKTTWSSLKEEFGNNFVKLKLSLRPLKYFLMKIHFENGNEVSMLWLFIYQGASKIKNVQMVLWMHRSEKLLWKYQFYINMWHGTSKKLLVFIFLICLPFRFALDYLLVEGLSRTRSTVDVLKLSGVV